MDPAPTLGQLIRMARQEAELTQEALGERLGTNQSSVAAWESGKVTPKVHVLLALAQVLGVDEHAFLDAAKADFTEVLAQYPVEP